MEVAVGVTTAAVAVIAIVSVVQLGIIIHDRIKAKRRSKKLKRKMRERIEMYYSQMESTVQMTPFQQQQQPQQPQQHQPFNGGIGNPWLDGNMGMNRTSVQQFYEQGEQRYRHRCEATLEDKKKKKSGWVKIKAVFKKQKKKGKTSKKDKETDEADEHSNDDDFVATAYIPIYFADERRCEDERVQNNCTLSGVCEVPAPICPPESSPIPLGAGLYPQLQQNIPTAPSLAPQLMHQQERAMYNGDTVPRRYGCVSEVAQPLPNAFSRPAQGVYGECLCTPPHAEPNVKVNVQPVETALRSREKINGNLCNKDNLDEYSITDSK